MRTVECIIYAHQKVSSVQCLCYFSPDVMSDKLISLNPLTQAIINVDVYWYCISSSFCCPFSSNIYIFFLLWNSGLGQCWDLVVKLIIVKNSRHIRVYKICTVRKSWLYEYSTLMMKFVKNLLYAYTSIPKYTLDFRPFLRNCMLNLFPNQVQQYKIPATSYLQKECKRNGQCCKTINHTEQPIRTVLCLSPLK